MATELPHQPLRSFTYYETVERDEPEPLPSELNTVSKHHALQASKDKLEVRYVGKGNHSHDVGAIRADRPCPQRRVLYYFEVTVLDAGLRGSIAVGLADSTLQLCRQPGWEPNSYGYHGADGRKYTDSERGESYGPAFTTGDVVGCGVLCLSRRQVFFTKNGRHLGDAFVGVGGVLYPTVGLHSPNERVAINFGGSPFKFDCEALVASEREARVEQVAKVPVSDASVHRLVRAYLLHHTYEKTLDALDAATPVPIAANGATAAAAPAAAAATPAAAAPAAADDAAPTEDAAAVAARAEAEAAAAAAAAAAEEEAAMRESLGARRSLREKVLGGDIGGAIALSDELFPGLLTAQPTVLFLLRCQGFIELVRSRDEMGALTYAQEHLHAYQEDAAVARHHPGMLRDVVALLAYADPAASADASCARLLADSHRELVADALSGAVLQRHGVNPACAIERILRQLVAVHGALREANGGCGQTFELKQ